MLSGAHPLFYPFTLRPPSFVFPLGRVDNTKTSNYILFFGRQMDMFTREPDRYTLVKNGGGRDTFGERLLSLFALARKAIHVQRLRNMPHSDVLHNKFL